MENMNNQEEKCSVLIVDDEVININALTHSLKPKYTVHAVISGEDAVAAAEKYAPDIILLDIVMPGMDGYEVLTELKSRESTKYIPVIFLTSKNDPESENRGLRLGAVDYIFKPFSQGLLLKRIELHLLLVAQIKELNELRGGE